MKNIAIVCDVMKSDLTEREDIDSSNTDYIFMEQQLHNTPNIMRIRLQEEIDKVSSDYDKIILSYGLCSNGVVGLKSKTHEIIIPRVDDCISLFLGSKERYIEEFKKDPATYYLCKGWIEYGGDPYRAYLVWTGRDKHLPKGWFLNKEVYGKNYDEATAMMLFVEMLKNYKRVVLINNDDLEKIHFDYAKEMVDFMTEALGRETVLEEIKGSSRFLKKLINCEWDDKNFLRVQPGVEILQNEFFDIQ